MHTLGAGEVLDLWERADGLGTVERALVLAAASGNGPQSEDSIGLADAPLGRCNMALLQLRTAVFGPELAATVACPACGEEVEFAADTAVMDGSVDVCDPSPVECDGWSVAWRSPSTADLAAAGAAGGGALDAEQVLLERCVLSLAGPEGAPAQVGDLPGAVRTAVGEAMAAADPLAEILVDLACPACGTWFATEIDVPSFVWTELRACARRVLYEVDVLARAYGWTEAEVLALGDARRAAYLRMVTGGDG